MMAVYESFKIPERIQRDDGASQSAPKIAEQAALSDGPFYEIEYGAHPIPGVGKLVLKPQRIEEPEKDAVRDVFTQMRDIARSHRSTYDFSRFFERRIQNDNSVIFYQQGMFMKDFEDDFADSKPFSQYFPYYQMMGYEQLRTYFTWRTKVRQGNIADTSLSYAFLYIYELLGNIGVNDPQDGLDRLMAFWKGFGVHNKTIDKYVIRWLKDYHIYYTLPHSFKEFAENNNLTGHYPAITDPGEDFGLFCSISRYDIRKSAFYSDDASSMIAACFSFVMDKVRQDFEAAGIRFDDSLFRPTRKLVAWKPFEGALFHHWLKQPDRRIVLSENEIYICKNNDWKFSTIITTEKGRQFIGFVMKQMEAVLRKATKYKFKLTANTNMVHEDTIRILTRSGLFIEKIVPAAVLEYYKEATKTVVTVDHTSLARIRQEALATQESLIVEEQAVAAPAPVILPELNQDIFADDAITEPPAISDSWGSLKNVLDDNELKALSVVLHGDELKAFADECGVMLEVLVDGINEKATDYIGDNLMDEEFVLYDDYREQVQEMLK
jgi:hypothetical protein